MSRRWARPHGSTRLVRSRLPIVVLGRRRIERHDPRSRPRFIKGAGRFSRRRGPTRYRQRSGHPSTLGRTSKTGPIGVRTRKGSDALFLRLEQAGADPVQSREWVDRAGTTTEARRTGAHDPGPVRLGQPVAGRRAARRPDPDQEPEPEGQGRPGQRYPDRAVPVLRARPASPIDGRDNAHRDRVRGERGRVGRVGRVGGGDGDDRPADLLRRRDQAAGRDGLAPGRGGGVGVGGGHGHGQFPRGAAGRSVGPLAGRAGRDSAGRATGAGSRGSWPCNEPPPRRTPSSRRRPAPWSS